MARKAPKKPMVTTIPITKARSNLGTLVKRVHLNKEYFILERAGIPIVGMMDIEELLRELQERGKEKATRRRKS